MSTKALAPLAHKKPSLFWTESELSLALSRLATTDPEEAMGEDEAAAFLAQYVSLDAVAAKRDEVAKFLLAAESFAKSKREEAAKIIAQAVAIETGASSMSRQVVRCMEAVGADALQGETFVLQLKRSRGAVEVLDEDLIPAEYWRVKEHEAVERIRDILALIAPTEANGATLVDDVLFKEIAAIAGVAVESLRDRSVDKTLIQAEWKAHGETREEVDAETGEVTEAPMVPGARRLVTTKLEIK